MDYRVHTHLELMLKFILSIIFSLFLFTQYVHAAEKALDSSQDQHDDLQSKAQWLIDQMNSAINSRKSDNIHNFVEYYISKNAVISKKSIVVAQEEQEQNTKDITYTRDKYIAALVSIANSGTNYSYKAKLNSIQASNNGRSAVLSISISEYSQLKSYGDYVKDKAVVEMLVNANCNYSIIKSSDSILITGMNCIEKIALE